MKKILCAALALFLALTSLAGCGKKGGEYVIYVDSYAPPFTDHTAGTNTYTGLAPDILAAIAADQGFTYTLGYAVSDAGMDAVQSGEADGAMMRLPITDEAKRDFDFSKSYFDDGQVMAVAVGSALAKPEDLRGKLVACVISDPAAEVPATVWAEANAEKYGFTIQYYETPALMYNAILSGSCDACFGQRSEMAWDIKRDGLGLQVVGDKLDPQSFGLAVKRGTNAKLLGMFNAGLADMKENGKLAEILAKYGF
ncbi:MAG: transporter substrate-binding domain-containing protein [Firmicutes bacterium]|nr:transporter substrate-binding domain-containing protein [Bacillota bacterium]